MTSQTQEIPCTIGILTHNSEEGLARCLESVRHFGEILIADGGSTDRTIEIAHKFGATVIPQTRRGKPIEDFSLERNAILDRSKYDWHFYLDSDDALSEELVQKIRTITEAAHPPYLVYRARYFLTSPDFEKRYQSFKPYYQDRLFNRKSGARFVKPMHEKIAFDRSNFPVGSIEEPWLVPLDTQLSFSVYKKKVQYRIDIMASSWKNKNSLVYIRTALLGPLFEAMKFLFKAAALRCMYSWSEIVPFRYELYRMYSQFYAMYAHTRQFMQNRKHIARKKA